MTATVLLLRYCLSVRFAPYEIALIVRRIALSNGVIIAESRKDQAFATVIQLSVRCNLALSACRLQLFS